MAKEVALSPPQKRVYSFLKKKFYASGSMPTLREICSEMGWSAIGSAQTVIAALLEKGLIKRDAQKARGLHLADGEDFRSVPVLGSAPAGIPVEAAEAHEGDVLVPSFIRGPVFAVRVQGESMKDAGILDHDIAIVRQAAHAEDGDIVVAMVDGEVTIKRLKKKSGEIWLHPENSRFKPRLITDPHFRILGKVVGLHRYWE